MAEPPMSRSLRLLQSLCSRRHLVTAAGLTVDPEVPERTTYSDVANLVARGAPISGEAGVVGHILRPGLFLPPLVLAEDELEVVLLSLRYVDRPGDAVLNVAGASARAKIGAVLSPQF